MKDLSSLIVLFFSGTLAVFPSAFADLPGDDPVVAQLRNEFSSAAAPTAANLNLGKTWNCRTFNAESDFSNVNVVNTDSFNFSNYDGLYLNSAPTGSVPSTFAVTQSDLSASRYFNNSLDAICLGYEHIRVTPAGDLIVEVEAPLNYCLLSGDVVGSISNPSDYTFSYDICPLNQISN